MSNTNQGSLIFAPAEISAIRLQLLDWYQSHGRVLPWRDNEGDAYRIVVSEMMLVQTTVATVKSYYQRFLDRFPTVHDLARAEVTDVLKMWEGLGYYRRATQLHSMARQVVEDYEGKFPENEADLLKLKGVGRYIAGAIRSFAFNQPAPILEANTIRVHARLAALDESINDAKTLKKLWNQAELLVDPDRPGDFNQAMMDLGAMICTPNTPSCLLCPVSELCQSYQKGLTAKIPVKPPKTPAKTGKESALLIINGHDHSILLMQRPSSGLWSDFWEIPTFWTSGADPAKRADTGWSWDGSPPSFASSILNALGAETDQTEPLQIKTIPYVVTTHKMELTLYELRFDPSSLFGESLLKLKHPFSFFSPHAMSRLTISSPHRRLLRHLEGR